MVARQTLTLFVWVQILVPQPYSLGKPRLAFFEVWLSLVERYVRDVEVAGSNPVTSTILVSSEIQHLCGFPRFFYYTERWFGVYLGFTHEISGAGQRQLPQMLAPEPAERCGRKYLCSWTPANVPMQMKRFLRLLCW